MNLRSSEIAATLEISPAAVSMWRNKVPTLRRVQLEQRLYATRGVQVEDFGTDVCWHRVPDPAWPHPGGRPTIDVAAPRVEVRDAA